MQTLMTYNMRGPPANWKEIAADLLAAMKALKLLLNKKETRNCG